MKLFENETLKIEYSNKYERYLIKTCTNNFWVSLSETSFRIFLLINQFGKNFESITIKQAPSEIQIMKSPNGIKIEFKGQNSSSKVYLNKQVSDGINNEIDELQKAFEQQCKVNEKEKLDKSLDGLDQPEMGCKRALDFSEKDDSVTKKPKLPCIEEESNPLPAPAKDEEYFTPRFFYSENNEPMHFTQPY